MVQESHRENTEVSQEGNSTSHRTTLHNSCNGKDAWENVSLAKDMETPVCTVNVIFHMTSVKKLQFEEMVQIAEYEVVA